MKATLSSNKDETQQLLAGLREKKTEAIEELIRKYSRPLFGVILNYTKNPSDAEEILQDTILKIVRKIDTFRGESGLWSWMKRIAVNNAIMWLRKHRTMRAHETPFEDGLPNFTDDGNHESPIYGWTVDPESATLNTELASQLYEAVQALPYEYRVPLVLRDVEGDSIKQISAALGLKEATTKTRIHRARLSVRERLSRYLDGSNE